MSASPSDLTKVLVALREQARSRASEAPERNLPSEFAQRYNAVTAALSDLVSINIPGLLNVSISAADLLSAIDFALATTGVPSPQFDPPTSTAGRLEESAEEVTPTPVAVTKRRPRVFIGCSTEGLRYAKIIQLQLEYSTQTTVWHQGVFGLSSGTLETLVAERSKYDYAVLVLTPDDLQIKREETGEVARDNVIFELGLFMGTLGRENVFMVVQKGVELPTDLAGITPAFFEQPPSDENLVVALGPVVTKLELAMGIL
jgi:predicted nucleotide-binding protein